MKIICILFLVVLFSCNAQSEHNNKKHSNMEKKEQQPRDTFDIKKYQQNEKEFKYSFVGRDSIKYKQWASGNRIADKPTEGVTGYVEYRTPTLPNLYKIGITYNSKGYSTIRGKLLLNLPIETWEYWDEKGNYTIVDEDKKFGKFDYKQVVNFIEKEGYLDRKTGKGLEHISLHFKGTPTLGGKIWIVIVNTGYSDIETYKLDGDTGKVLSHTTEPGGIE